MVISWPMRKYLGKQFTKHAFIINQFEISQAAASTLVADPVQQVSVLPPPTSRPPPVYDMPLPEEPTKKMDIETIKEVIKKEPGLAERVTLLKASGVGFDVDFVIGSTSNTAVRIF